MSKIEIGKFTHSKMLVVSSWSVVRKWASVRTIKCTWIHFHTRTCPHTHTLTTFLAQVHVLVQTLQKRNSNNNSNRKKWEEIVGIAGEVEQQPENGNFTICMNFPNNSQNLLNYSIPKFSVFLPKQIATATYSIDIITNSSNMYCACCCVLCLCVRMFGDDDCAQISFTLFKCFAAVFSLSLPPAKEEICISSRNEEKCRETTPRHTRTVREREGRRVGAIVNLKMYKPLKSEVGFFIRRTANIDCTLKRYRHGTERTHTHLRSWEFWVFLQYSPHSNDFRNR